MKLRDFSIMLLIMGIAASVFVTMMTDTELEDNYGTFTAHSEDNFTSISRLMNESANEQEDKADTLQDSILGEDEVSYLGVGAATFNVIKAPLTFDYLDGVNDIVTAIQNKFSIPPAIVGFIMAVFLLSIIFTIVGAFLRWRT